jgi:methionyl-tRNA formyltransferase
MRKLLAMTPSPGAYAFLRGEKVKVWEARLPDIASSDRREARRPGEVTDVDGVIGVAAGEGGLIEITKLQSPGGRAMSSSDWLRGHSVKPGEIFE